MKIAANFAVLCLFLAAACGAALAEEKGPTRLTSDTWPDRAPRFSPDGKRISWLSKRENGWRVVVRDFAGGAETLLPPKVPEDTSVEWSADGAQIACTSLAGLKRKAVLIHLSDLSVREAGEGRNPTYSPDGGKLAWLGRDGVHVLNLADGTASQPYQTDTPASADRLAWSRDSKRIAFSLNNDLWLVELASGQSRQLVSSTKGDVAAGAARAPLFAPDGGIYLTRDTGGLFVGVTDNRLEFIPPSGGEAEHLTDANGWCLSPNGKLLVFNLGDSLFAQPLPFRKDAKPELLGNGVSPAFSPDGKKLVFLWRVQDGDEFDIYCRQVE